MKSIGKYQVIEQLGVSVAGATYKVRDTFRNREFALKLLQTVPNLSPRAKEKLCLHLSSCSELGHRNIVKVHDLGEVEEGLFVVSELRTGMDLRQFFEHNREIPLVQKLASMAQVAEGLAFAHSREISHGNLKPSNAFIDGARDVTILDFGSADWLAALLAAGSRPENLLVNYLAPEQILGNAFDARSDIFTLGVMLYEFATGRYPFAAASSLIPREIVHSQAEPLRKIDPQIPVELEQLVNRALQKDPEQRLQTAEEFAAGLYVAAQELRRRASAARAETNVAEANFDVSETPNIEAEPPIEILKAGAEFPSIVIAEASRAAEPPARERPQDQACAGQPWTARSYSAGAPLAKNTAFALPEPPASTPPKHTDQPVGPQPQEIPEATAPPANPVALPAPHKATAPGRPAPPPQPRPVQISKRAVALVCGLILAVAIVGSLASRQRLRASQKPSAVTKVLRSSPAPAAAPQITTQAAPAQKELAPKPVESGPNGLGNPEFAIKQSLNGPVRSLWEGGRYNEALALVNQILADHPNNASARSWKRKIVDAQEAEAALK